MANFDIKVNLEPTWKRMIDSIKTQKRDLYIKLNGGWVLVHKAIFFNSCGYFKVKNFEHMIFSAN